MEAQVWNNFCLPITLGLVRFGPLWYYVHASFPFQDSFAKCFPSRYGLYSVTASSTHGDTWLEKSSPSDEPDRKKQQESGSDQRYTLKGSRNSKGSWFGSKGRWFVAREVDTWRSWIMKKKISLKIHPGGPGSWTGSQKNKKTFSRKGCFNNFLPQIERCQAGSSKGFSNNKNRIHQNPLEHSNPRPSWEPVCGGQQRTNESPGIFFSFKTKGWLGSVHIKGVSIDTSWFFITQKKIDCTHFLMSMMCVLYLRKIWCRYCSCFLPHSWFFAPICSGESWPTCNDGWICSGHQDAQSAMVTHFGLCEATWLFWKEIWMKEMT